MCSPDLIRMITRIRYMLFAEGRLPMLHLRPLIALLVLGLNLMCGAWTAHAGAAELFVKNDCSDEIRLAVRYQDSTSATWQTKAWYALGPGKRTYLASRGKRLRTNSSVIYFYAESAVRKIVWAGRRDNENDRSYTVDGRELRFRYVRDAKGNRNLRLTCPSPPPSMGPQPGADLPSEPERLLPRVRAITGPTRPPSATRLCRGIVVSVPVSRERPTRLRG